MEPAQTAKQNAEHRVDHVVDAKPFRADGPGHEDPVKEPQNPAEEAGPGEQQRARNKCPLSRGQPAAYGL